MDFMLPITIPKADRLMNHQQKILSIGSCFTEHIGNALTELKFDVLQNPNGILFDPIAVCNSLVSYIQNKVYTEDDLFYLNELWHSWQHHSRFSHTDQQHALANINASQQKAHNFLQQADWLIITLGSAFSYRLTNESSTKMAAQNPPPFGESEGKVLPTATGRRLNGSISIYLLLMKSYPN